MSALYFACPFCCAPLPVVMAPSVEDFTIEGTRSPGRRPRVTITYRPRHVLTHECVLGQRLADLAGLEQGAQR